MRTLIFATREESKQLETLLNARVFDQSSQEPAAARCLLKYLDGDKDAVAIVVGDSFVTGWATYQPTQVLFSRNYPTDVNIRTQARSRARFDIMLGAA